MFRTPTQTDAGPPHPGEILREDIVPLIAMSKRDLARHLAISPRVLSELLAEKRGVTLELALKLGAALGQGARYWLAGFAGPARRVARGPLRGDACRRAAFMGKEAALTALALRISLLHGKLAMTALYPRCWQTSRGDIARAAHHAAD